jgi:hypothetical protein
MIQLQQIKPFLKGEIQDIKFLCLAGTVFDQETRVSFNLVTHT